MTRIEWQELAERWLVDAKHLLDRKRWSAAYYLAGYAVECGLKSCVLANLARKPETVFEIKDFSRDLFTHNVAKLVQLAGLEAVREVDMADNQLGENWSVVKVWDEKSRYRSATHQKAKKFFHAIVDEKH